jgi:hypothetical protein
VGTRYYIERTKYFFSRMALISHRAKDIEQKQAKKKKTQNNRKISSTEPTNYLKMKTLVCYNFNRTCIRLD